MDASEVVEGAVHLLRMAAYALASVGALVAAWVLYVGHRERTAARRRREESWRR